MSFDADRFPPAGGMTDAPAGGMPVEPAETPVAPELARLAQAFAAMCVRLDQPEPADERAAAPTLRAVAARAWIAAAQGHVCIRVSRPECEDLSASLAVTTEPAVRIAPLVLDGAHLYLARLWRAETGLAACLVAADRPGALAAPAELQSAIARVFEEVDPADAQQQAVLTALQRRLCVITGGPGTGKTSTLARLLVAFTHLRPTLRVAYAAPTGKAAARLAQALADAVAHLDPSGEIGRRLPGAGLTVHRLLGRQPDVPALETLDLVIVDEASMLDLELAHDLVSRLGEQTRLVLAGDRDQLASVEAGAVFAELCEARLDGRVRLLRNWRQREAPGIAALAAAIREGQVPADAPATPDVALRAAEPNDVLARALAGFEPALARVRAVPGADDQDAVEIMQANDRFRVLCAQRGGPLGTLALNAAIARRVHDGPAAWYPGRLVMVTRNETARQLFNGDVGVCLPWAQRDGALAVAFVAGTVVRWVPLAQMPVCEDAWAMTIHKSQGSEFEGVALLPAAPGHPLNTRELIYTGVTRARNQLQVHASMAVLAQAAARPAARHGRLAQRIDALRIASPD
ncbi:MAG: exodeoxyribonuclease V subunit alpha [Burkholderiaceae bacterium]|nr:exodeoxyribonuclease V subunit alpha [Burkholderiaceae bacterium]